MEYENLEALSLFISKKCISLIVSFVFNLKVTVKRHASTAEQARHEARQTNNKYGSGNTDDIQSADRPGGQHIYQLALL